jgi:hypothetical protein
MEKQKYTRGAQLPEPYATDDRPPRAVTQEVPAATPGLPELPFHPVTDLLPLLEGAEYEVFRANLKKVGLKVPIQTYQGQVIEGRNRYRACLELGIPPRFEEWDGHGSLVEHVLALNLHRRQLSPSQRAMVAAKAKDHFAAEARQRMLAGTAAGNPPPNSEEGQAGEAAEKAAELLGVGKGSVYMGQKVLQQGSQELQQAVERGEVSVSAAADLADLPPEEQAEAVAEGEQTVHTKVKEVRQRKNDRQKKKAGPNENGRGSQNGAGGQRGVDGGESTPQGAQSAAEREIPPVPTNLAEAIFQVKQIEDQLTNMARAFKAPPWVRLTYFEKSDLLKRLRRIMDAVNAVTRVFVDRERNEEIVQGPKVDPPKP